VVQGTPIRTARQVDIAAEPGPTLLTGRHLPSRLACCQRSELRIPYSAWVAFASSESANCGRGDL
jgi:hypothetical protein